VTLVVGRAAGDPSSWAGHPVVVPISRRWSPWRRRWPAQRR